MFQKKLIKLNIKLKYDNKLDFNPNLFFLLFNLDFFSLIMYNLNKIKK